MGLDVGILATGGGGVSQAQLDAKADADDVVDLSTDQDVYGSKSWFDPQTFNNINVTDGAFSTVQSERVATPSLALTGGVTLDGYDYNNIDYFEATNSKTSVQTTNLFYNQPTGINIPVNGTRWLNQNTGEIILVNSGSSGAITSFSRAQYGTTAAAISIGDTFYPLYEGVYSYQMLSDQSAGTAIVAVSADGVAPVNLLLPDLTVDPWSGDVLIRIKDALGGSGTGSCVINVTEPTSGFSATIDVARGILPLLVDIPNLFYGVEGTY